MKKTRLIFVEYNRTFGSRLSAKEFVMAKDSANAKTLAQSIFDYLKTNALESYENRKARFGQEMFTKFERFIHLQSMDYYWKEHLTNMDHLREGIYLRSYGQKNPLHEYQREAFELFSEMMINISNVVLAHVFNAELLTEEEIKKREEEEKERHRKEAEAAKTIHEDASSTKSAKEKSVQGLNRKQRRELEAHNKKDQKRGVR